MEYDLLIKGGRVVDGSGLPGYLADVGIKEGKIVALGRLKGTAARTIDASGLVVAPGFIDHHTHLDAQLFWDPYGTSEPQHGVTTVVMGNCGLTLAPVEPGGEDALVKSFVRVEAMPRPTLEQGVPWGWKSFGDYLDALEGKVGINVGGLVGHIAVRHRVMGEAGVEREATPAEIEQMRGLVREALQGGALGISTNRNERHFREDGKPVSSRVATDDELYALCDVLTEQNTGVIETILGLNRVEQVPWYDHLARRTGRPVIWQSVLHRWTTPNLWREQLDAVSATFRDGFRAYGLTNTMPIVSRFTMNNAQTFDEFPVWKNLMFLPELVRKQAFADPATRQKMREDMDAPQTTTFHRRWDLVKIIKVGKPENARFVGQSVAEMAAARGQDPLDALLDLSLEENLETTFWSANSGGDPHAVGQILQSPYVLVGLSDAGAHVEFDANFGYGTTLLGMWVRERGVLSLEHAVHKLTFEVASVYGIQGRGLVRLGYAADLAIFDPATVQACEPEYAYDFPAGARRLVQQSEGLHYTVVNGRVVFEAGRLSGDLPGQVLRGAAYDPARQGLAAVSS
jgi:N-acyl-D-aspartate/D-glutamate deacylase